MVKDQRYRSACIFGAVCSVRDTGAALVLTRISVRAMNMLFEEVSSQLSPSMLIDNARWHTANHLRELPSITLVQLPRYSPERNAIEGAWQYLRRHPSGRLFAGTRAIADACWDALGELGAHPIDAQVATKIGSKKIALER